MSLMRWNPYREVASLREAMNRLFEDRFFHPLRTWTGPMQGQSALAIDMYESDDDLVIRASMPGVKPDEVDVSVTGDRVTINGEFKSEDEAKKGNIHIQEHYYGSFQRVVTLPVDVDADAAEATFKDGVLRITFPKMKEASRKRITVEGEQHVETN